MTLLIKFAAISAIALSFPNTAVAHGGGLNSQGCHNQSSNGSYHCHRTQRSRQIAQPAMRNGAFVNCAAARNAGYQNIRAGSYGYGRHLDRDNDGIGCES